MKELEKIESGLKTDILDISALNKQETMYRKFEPRIREKDEKSVKRLDSWKPLNLDETPASDKKKVFDSIFEPKKDTPLPPTPNVKNTQEVQPVKESPKLPPIPKNTTSTTPTPPSKIQPKSSTNEPKKNENTPTTPMTNEPKKNENTPTTPTTPITPTKPVQVVENRISTPIPAPPAKSAATMKKIDTLKELKNKPQQPPVTQQPIMQPTVQPKPMTIGEQIMKQTEKGVKYLPLKIIQTESVNAIFKENDILNYKLNGQIAVKIFNHSQSKMNEILKFTINFKNDQKLSSVVNNKNFSTKDEKGNKFHFEIPVEKFGEKFDQEVVLVKYNLVPDFKPIPIKIILNKLVKENQIQIQIKYKINPICNLSKLSFLLSPLYQDGNVKIIKQESKPEGKWNSVQEKILWRLQDPELQGTLVSMYKTDNIPVNTQTPPVLLQFSADGISFSDLVIDGCDSKRSEDFEVFVGGIEKILNSGKYEFQFN